MVTIPQGRCWNCDSPFNHIPKCLGTTVTQCCVQAYGIGKAMCLHCCERNYPESYRPLWIVTTEGKITMINCSRCLRGFNEGVFACTCCPTSVRHGRCAECCGVIGHKCCRQVIRFRPVDGPPDFAYPRQGVYPVPSFCTRDEALGILGKTWSGKYLSLKGFTKNRLRRFAAVEIEVSGYTNAKALNTVLDKWGCPVVHDTSMQSNRGFEINTTPACGNVLVDELTEICDALIEGDARVNLHCGLHVHVDCRDFGYQEIQRFVNLYRCIEDTLFAAVHTSRHNNRFCGRCGDRYYRKFIKGVKPETKTLKKAVIESIYGPDALKIANPRPGLRRTTSLFHHTRADHYGRRGGEERNELRYAAVNLHSYFLRGTVEFRLHHGAVDFPEIYGWTKLLLDIFDAIYKTSEFRLDTILKVSQDEIDGAMKLLTEDARYGAAELNSTVKGLVILRSLLPDNSFEHLVNKINLMCGNSHIHSDGWLPADLIRNKRIGNKPAISINSKIQEV